MVVSNKLTPLQNTRLIEHGITSLYQLITYLPTRYSEILPIQTTAQIKEGGRIYTLAKILNHTILGGGKARTKITLDTKHGIIVCYSFLPYRFLVKTLKDPREVTAFLHFQNGFWALEKFSYNHPNNNQSVIIQYYPKLKSLDSTFFRSVFARLTVEDFILSLHGLIDPRLGIPELLSLQPLHRPENRESIDKTLHNWKLFQAYLKLAELKYFQNIIDLEKGRGISISPAIKEKLLSAHPYILSESQLSTVSYLLDKLQVR